MRKFLIALFAFIFGCGKPVLFDGHFQRITDTRWHFKIEANEVIYFFFEREDAYDIVEQYYTTKSIYFTVQQRNPNEELPEMFDIKIELAEPDLIKANVRIWNGQEWETEFWEFKKIP